MNGIRRTALILPPVAAIALCTGFALRILTTSTPQPDDPVIPPPGYLPPATSDRSLKAAVDRRLTESVRLKAIDQLPPAWEPSPEDRQALRRVLGDRKDSDTIRHEVALLLRKLRDTKVWPILRDILEDQHETERFRSFATQHVGDMLAGAHVAPATKDNIRSLLHKLLATDRHDLVRRQALQSLGRLGDEKSIADMERIVRGGSEQPLIDTAMALAVDRGRRDLLGDIRRHARADDAYVRRRAIALLGEMRDPASRHLFEAAAASDEPALRAAGQLALQRLDKGEDAP